MFWQPEFPACECAYQDHGKGDEPDHQRIGHVGGPTMEERSSQNMSWNGGRQMTRSRSEGGTRPAGLVDELNRTMTGSWHSIAVVHFNPLGVLWPDLVRPWTFTPRIEQGRPCAGRRGPRRACTRHGMFGAPAPCSSHCRAQCG